MADFQKSIYELAQWLGNKRKNAHHRTFALNGDPNGNLGVEPNNPLKRLKKKMGFLGVFLLFLACAALIFCGIRAASKAEDFFSFLLAMGITMVYGIQTVINALVVSGSIPPTGLPLPLISSGNTSLIITMASMGVLYAISAKGNKSPKAVQGTKRGKKFIQ